MTDLNVPSLYFHGPAAAGTAGEEGWAASSPCRTQQLRTALCHLDTTHCGCRDYGQTLVTLGPQRGRSLEASNTFPAQKEVLGASGRNQWIEAIPLKPRTDGLPDTQVCRGRRHVGGK